MLLWAYAVWFSRRFPTALASHGKSSDYRAWSFIHDRCMPLVCHSGVGCLGHRLHMAAVIGSGCLLVRLQFKQFKITKRRFVRMRDGSPASLWTHAAPSIALRIDAGLAHRSKSLVSTASGYYAFAAIGRLLDVSSAWAMWAHRGWRRSAEEEMEAEALGQKSPTGAPSWNPNGATCLTW